MTVRQTVPERVGSWFQAYSVIRDELTSPKVRQGEPTAIDVQRIICANDRTAALVAAMLVTSGIRPVAMDGEDD